MKFLPPASVYIYQFQTNGFPLPAPICLFSNRDLSHFPLGIFFTWYIISFYLLFWLPANTELIRKEVLFPKASVLRGSGLLRSRILCVNHLPSHFIWHLMALAIIFLRFFLVPLISLCTLWAALDHQQTFPMLWCLWPIECVMELVQRALGLGTS